MGKIDHAKQNFEKVPALITLRNETNFLFDTALVMTKTYSFNSSFYQ